MVPPSLIGHQFPMRLQNDSIEVFESVLDVNTHRIAKPERNDINDVASMVDILGHTGGVL